MADDKQQEGVTIMIDYYKPAFAALHSLLVDDEFERQLQRKRENFWGNIPGNSYKPHKGSEILEIYATSIKKELKNILSYDCLEYWMHIYRRLYPGQINDDSRASTIARTRQLLDLAISKYSFTQPCFRIGNSTTVGRDKILNGFLMTDEFEFILNAVCKQEQLVLTDFGLDELKSLYLAEAYAGELARISSCIRTVRKGANLYVSRNPANYMAITSTELHTLLKTFDDRNEEGDRGYFPSATAVVAMQNGIDREGLILTPTINAKGEDDPLFTELSKKFHGITFELLEKSKPNFILTPFDIKTYYNAHKPLSTNYAKRHKTSLESVIITIYSAARYAMSRAFTTFSDLVQLTQRGYLCAANKGFLLDTFFTNMEHAKHNLGIDIEITRADLSHAYDVMALTEMKVKAIDLRYPGPFSLFLSSTHGVILDLSHFGEILHNLFFGVKLDKLNYKGPLLEQLISTSNAYVSGGVFKSHDSTSEEIDAIFKFSDEILIVVECKAIAMSVAFDIGHEESVEFRKTKMVAALNQVERKGKWLSKHMAGHGYDLSAYKHILTVVVSPFVEFIDSYSKRYWVTKNTPRILTPGELFEFTSGVVASDQIHQENLITVVQPRFGWRLPC